MKFTSGKASITMSDELAKMVRRVVEKTAPRVLAVMESANEKIADRARKAWPVGREHVPPRAHSRDLIETGTGVTPSGVVAYTLVDVSYVFYIKSKKALGGGSPWQRLLRNPGIAAGKRIAVDCAVDLRKLAGGQ